MAYATKFRLDRFIPSPSAAEKPHFLQYFRIRHLLVSPVGSNLRKLSSGAQLQTFRYPKETKSFLYSNAFMAKSGTQALTFKSVTDRQKNRQTEKQTDKNNSTFLAAMVAGEIRAPPTWHGDRGPRARSCTCKTFAGLTYSFAARGRRKFGDNQTPST